MRTLLSLLLASLTVLSSLALADSPAPPIPWMTTSERGRSLFKMVPEQGRFVDDRYQMESPAFGVAYVINDLGDLDEIWRVSGWYTFQGFLSEDGRYFVRMGPWASDQSHHTDLAIAFYDEGKLLREYQVRELIQDPDTLEDSVSHYTWRPVEQSEPTDIYGETFHLVMVDKTAYSFDLTTGEILRKTIDEGAKSRRQLWQEEERAEQERGERLLEAWPHRKAFEKAFELSDVKKGPANSKMSGVWFSGPEWLADLKPRKESRYSCKAAAVFPIREEAIDATITPAEILAVFDRLVEHPFVAGYLQKEGAEGFRLRITGDRLHWETDQLQEHLAKVKGREAKPDELRPWAELIIDTSDHQYQRLWFQVETREIIWEEQSTWPRKPILLGADEADLPE